MNKIVRKILRETLFLAKHLDDFEGFFNPGKDYKIIACCSSEELLEKYPNIIVHEVIKGVRTYSTSTIFQNMFNDYIQLDNKDYLNYWTYQAYSWTNDLKYAGKNVFAIDYFLYLKLQNKLNQKNVLLENSSVIENYFNKEKIGKNLTNTSKRLKTLIFPKGEIDYNQLRKKYKGQFVVCASYSDGGEGVFKISSYNEYINAIKQIESPVIRTEEFIQNAIPVNQIGFVTSNGKIIKYKPSIQIIRNLHQYNKMEYSGCDFKSELYIEKPDIILGEITSLTHWIGKILYGIGYQGTYGCDYLIEGNIPYFIEINPRYQASTRIPTLSIGKDPILSPHILHILGFIPPPLEYLPIINDLDKEYKYVNVIKSGDINGFLYIYDELVSGLRKPRTGINLDPRLNKGYIFFSKPIISCPYYPTQLLVS